MKINFFTEQLIRDLANSIRMDYSDNNIKRCYQFCTKKHIVDSLKNWPLKAFRYIPREEVEDLFNEVFIKDDRILNELKKFAKRKHYVYADIKLLKYDFHKPKPMLILYKTKEQYVKDTIHKYCNYIAYGEKKEIYDYGTVAYVEFEGFHQDLEVRDLFDELFIENNTVLNELKKFATKHGYADAKIERDYDDYPRFILYKNININKK